MSLFVHPGFPVNILPLHWLQNESLLLNIMAYLLFKLVYKRLRAINEVRHTHEDTNGRGKDRKTMKEVAREYGM